MRMESPTGAIREVHWGRRSDGACRAWMWTLWPVERVQAVAGSPWAAMNEVARKAWLLGWREI